MKHKIISPPLQNISIQDPLFGNYVRMVATKLVPYQWGVLNDTVKDVDKSHCIENFKIAAGLQEGTFHGVVFGDTDAYKWLETVAYCIENARASGDEALIAHMAEYEAYADGLIELLARAQQPDGYLNTYFTIVAPELRWTNLTEGHELYSAGHLIEAAVAYYEATGKSRIVEIAKRFADLIYEVFMREENRGCPGHQEIEIALIRLGRLCKEQRYIELAKHFIDVRGEEPNYFLEELQHQKHRFFPEFKDYDAGYAQSRMRPVNQERAEGHAVRAMYMYSAMTDLATEYRDKELRNACKRLWNNVTTRQMYITGGIGASGYLERFTTDYDLPNDRMYCESCASVGLMMFGSRMAAMTGEAGYYDTVERALCNTVLAGISAEGDRYFYVNPLEVWPANCLPGTSMSHVKPVRQPWFACACCPANIARTIASVGRYIYAQDDKSLYVNQFISSTVDTSLKDNRLSLRLDASEVLNGRVAITVDAGLTGAVTVKVRIPGYFREPVFELDGERIEPALEKGYAVLAISRNGVQNLLITGTVEPVFMAANDNVRADAGKIALTYGPYVFCLEQTDNCANLSGIFVRPTESTISVNTTDRLGLPGQLPVLGFTGYRISAGVDEGLYGASRITFKQKKLRAIPYCLWCNREPGEMLVWMHAMI